MSNPKRDYSETLFLPNTNFPMRAGLAQKEPEILKRWNAQDLYRQLRASSGGQKKFILHDGPPYANGNIHIGHAFNKILKDVVTRSQQMLGHDSIYVPGWDCHGLPIEWKIEEENYRSKNEPKPNLIDPAAIIAFREECRAYAERWLNVQREEFKRLGVEGNWNHPYTTMSFAAEAQIARELMKFAANGTLYRGSKPVMWSVVEKTALAEAEIDYKDYESDQVWVTFPVERVAPESGADDAATALALDLVKMSASVVIWTTTPWTLPCNRAISFSPKIEYGIYRVTEAPTKNWTKVGDTLVLSQKLAAGVLKQARVTAYEKVAAIPSSLLKALVCKHPLQIKGGYDFDVPLLAGEHVTDEAGTGFVHTAPGHGREDFDVWTSHARMLEARGINPSIPYTVDENGAFTNDAPGFTGKCVINDKGENGDANTAVIEALVETGTLIARSRLKHQYPHSWRSNKPVFFRNTPQWFIAMDKPIEAFSDTLRGIALSEIKATRWVPAASESRIQGMVQSRPDWVISRQRAWGVPITVFIKEHSEGVVVLDDPEVNARIIEAFETEGADAWYKRGATERFLGTRANEGWKKVDDILDVWFDSGSSHAFVLENSKHFGDLSNIKRGFNRGCDTVMYLEGSDQHRGWFHSSLLESCGTRGRAPYDVVLTHGFVLDEHGRKMSKSQGNVTAPQEVIEQFGADILRMWVCTSDYEGDLRIGPEILKTTAETYRRLRNTIRWMLGSLAHFKEEDRISPERMPELEQLMLHRLSELDEQVRKDHAEFDYKRIFSALNQFMIADLSAFYFDIRKDALYCDPISSVMRKSALTVIDHLFSCTVTWLAPMLCFTAEEAWLGRHGPESASVHLQQVREIPVYWRNDALAEKWRSVRRVRRVVTGALEIARADKQIGSSLEAAPIVYIADPHLFAAMEDVDLPELCITSGGSWVQSDGPPDAFRTPDVPGVAVMVEHAEGRKCARSWKISQFIGSDPHYPDVTQRDAMALREWDATRKTA